MYDNQAKSRDLPNCFQLALNPLCVLLNLDHTVYKGMLPTTYKRVFSRNSKTNKLLPRASTLTQTEFSMKMILQVQITIKAFPVCKRQQCTNNDSNPWENKRLCHQKQRLLWREETKYYLFVFYFSLPKGMGQKRGAYRIQSLHLQQRACSEWKYVPVALSTF